MPGLHRVGIDDRRDGVGRIVETVDKLESTDTKKTEQKQNRVTEIESKHRLFLQQVGIFVIAFLIETGRQTGQAEARQALRFDEALRLGDLPQ